MRGRSRQENGGGDMRLDFTFKDIAFLKAMHISPGDPELATEEEVALLTIPERRREYRRIYRQRISSERLARRILESGAL